MSEIDPEFGQDSLEHYEYDVGYQEEAEVLDSSLYRHRQVPLYQPGTQSQPETIVLAPDQRLGSPFDKVVIIYPVPNKDPYLPFVNIQMSRSQTGRELVIETRLHYFEERYLAIRSVYAITDEGNYELKPESFMESEVTTHDLSLLNEIINNSTAIS